MPTFCTPLQHALLTHRNDLAVVDGERRLTFAELGARLERLAGMLDALGIAVGDRVAILANNSAAYLEAYVGVPAAGRVIVPMNTRHAEPELEYALRDSGARLLLSDREPGRLAGIVERVVSLPDEYQTLLAGATPSALGIGVEEQTLAGLFYTGGTTGASKGVMLSHRNLIANTYHMLASVPQSHRDTYLVMAPMFHAAGSNSVLGCLWTGSPQIVLDAFDPNAALDLIAAHGVTMTLAVPTMLAAMAEEQIARPRPTDSLRYILHGGSPIATEVLRRAHRAFPSAELIEVYGATELSPLATLLREEQALIDTPRARSCGQPCLGVTVSVRDADNQPLPQGEIGEVVVQGANVMLGYWGKPEQTEAVLKPSGYWTGDMGYLDEDGYLYLVDRSKDMIVSGGENVYCTEVEEVLYRHEAVLEAAVFGVPDERWGEAVHAVVVPRPEYGDVDPESIIAFCKAHIAGYKVPKAIDIRREPLPKSGPGKVLKRELRAPFWEGRERGIN